MSSSVTVSSSVQPDFSAIALRIHHGDSAAESEFVSGLTRGLRTVARHRLGFDSPDVDDVVNEVLRIAIENIRAGKLQDADRVLGYIHSVLNNVLIAQVKRRVRARSQKSIDPVVEMRLPDPQESPEKQLERQEMRAFVLRVLRSLNARDREILYRFYVEEQSQEMICAAMGLTETQFRLIKCRAKAKFGVVGSRKLKPPSLALVRRSNESGRAYTLSA